jgi:hypothetical protein
MNTIGVDAVGVWTFDEGSGGTAHDKSGYKNHGTIYNGATWVTGEENTPHWYVNEGEGRYAMSFDGLNDMVRVSPSNPFEYRGEDITISFWAKPDSAETTGGKMISKPWNGNGQYNYWISYNSNKTVNIRLYGSSSWRSNTTKKLSANAWNHIVMTVVGTTKNVIVYFNGKMVKDTTHNITGWTPSAGDRNIPLSIGTLYPYGTWGGNTGFSFNGLIDEVCIYERALSSSEIQQHYADGAEKHQIALK